MPIRIENNPNQESVEEKIEKEKEYARRVFLVLIELVNKHHECPESVLAQDPEQLRAFKEHNEDVLNYCIERGITKGLSEKELRELEVAAILHDKSKIDNLENTEFSDIPNYALAAHNERVASEVERIIKEYPRVLSHILGDNYSKDEAREAIETIKGAIICHMGPNPGFMKDILTMVNEKSQEINKRRDEKKLSQIEHPYPKEGDKVGETLLAVDMYSLASRKGREKILTIRAGSPFFKSQDEETVRVYKERDIDLSVGEAALLSAFDSAVQAAFVVRNEEDRMWIEEVIETSKDDTYFYSGVDGKVAVNCRTALEKRERCLRT